jgi:hypothetical protein
MVVVTLESKIDLSHLKWIELDNSNKINDRINMSQERNLNTHY